MATRKTKPAPTSGRTYKDEEKRRPTNVQRLMKLTEEEAARVDGLAERLGNVPHKRAMLAAVEAAHLALDGADLGQVAGALRTGLEPAKPGRKVSPPKP